MDLLNLDASTSWSVMASLAAGCGEAWAGSKTCGRVVADFASKRRYRPCDSFTGELKRVLWSSEHPTGAVMDRGRLVELPLLSQDPSRLVSSGLCDAAARLCL